MNPFPRLTGLREARPVAAVIAAIIATVRAGDDKRGLRTEFHRVVRRNHDGALVALLHPPTSFHPLLNGTNSVLEQNPELFNGFAPLSQGPALRPGLAWPIRQAWLRGRNRPRNGRWTAPTIEVAAGH
jgi:hypothetical protein